MPRPRIPNEKAKVTGAIVCNAPRFKDRKTPKKKRPIGKPFKSMTPAQCAAWTECVGEMLWLHSGHRQLLRAACIQIARMNADPNVPTNVINSLHVILSKLGATPTDETKVNHGDDDEEDPADEFFGQKPN